MSQLGRMAACFGCAGPVLLPEERTFFRDADPFGFILFARNIENPAQVSRLTADLRAAVRLVAAPRARPGRGRAASGWAKLRPGC